MGYTADTTLLDDDFGVVALFGQRQLEPKR